MELIWKKIDHLFFSLYLSSDLTLFSYFGVNFYFLKYCVQFFFLLSLLLTMAAFI